VTTRLATSINAPNAITVSRCWKVIISGWFLKA
jgi:hypothetical protein